MPSASTIRLQVESALAHKIPSALTPVAKAIRPVVTTGIEVLDSLLHGGLPVGAVTELVGPECSGRSTVAASFLARLTQASKVCAWIDVSNTFDPVTAAGAGLDLERLLWVRCGALQATVRRADREFYLPEKYLVSAAPIKGLHGGGCGSHPRNEVKGLSAAVGGLFHSETIAPRCAEPQRKIRFAEPQPRVRPQPSAFAASYHIAPAAIKASVKATATSKPWPRIEQALRTTDLLLQAGGFSAIVLDMASLAPEIVSRVPLATWHRYRLASERTQSSILLLTQHSCAKSSAELLLRLQPADALGDEDTVFTGIKSQLEVVRQRFSQTSNNVTQLRKPPQRSNAASWQSRTAWAGQR